MLAWAVCGAAVGDAQEYLGSAVCAECHRDEYQKQQQTRHARALRPILETRLPELLGGAPFRERGGAGFEYRSTGKGLQVIARKGGQQAGALLEWAFGAGAQAFTPVGRAGRIYFEHRVSYYVEPARGALTLGHPAGPSPSVTDALGMVQAPETIYRCFHCHSTGARPGAVAPDLSQMRPGIECERCHGPGGAHVSAARAPKPPAEIVRTLLNPGRFPASAVVEICAECHRLSPEGDGEDRLSVRFQPIGLMASRCFRASKKLSCLTCHDPHQDARHNDQAFYTAKCLGCHDPATRPGAQCRRAAKQDCQPCHMRRTSPAPYLSFTDHRIGVY